MPLVQAAQNLQHMPQTAHGIIAMHCPARERHIIGNLLPQAGFLLLAQRQFDQVRHKLAASALALHKQRERPVHEEPLNGRRQPLMHRQFLPGCSHGPQPHQNMLALRHGINAPHAIDPFRLHHLPASIHQCPR